MSLHRISLEEFAVDARLGNFPEASPAQRLVLRLIDGQPPADAQQARLFVKIAGRSWRKDLATPRRVVALILGASSGKSLMAALWLVHRALLASLKGLRPGQRGTGVLVAPDTRLATIPLRYAKGILNESPILRQELEARRRTR